MNLFEMKIQISFSRFWEWGKDYVLGNYHYNESIYVPPVQEFLATIYYIGFLRVNIIHKNKFIQH